MYGISPFRTDKARKWGDFPKIEKADRDKAIDLAIQQMEPDFDDNVFDDVIKDLIRRLLNKDGKLRLGANGYKEIIAHPWFACESLSYTVWCIYPSLFFCWSLPIILSYLFSFFIRYILLHLLIPLSTPSHRLGPHCQVHPSHEALRQGHQHRHPERDRVVPRREDQQEAGPDRRGS